MEKLTEHERASFISFAQLCHKENLLQRPPELHPDDTIDGLNDENTLLRFLRGRSFDINEACQQFKDALAIRQSFGGIAMYETIDIGDFERARSIYPHWSGCRNKSGMPICVFDIAQLDYAVMTEYCNSRNMSTSAGEMAVSNAKAHAIVFLDYLTRFVLPICTAMRDRENLDTAVTSAVCLVDISKMTLKQAWSLKSYAQDFSTLLATCYPEVLHRVYVLNAPPYFGLIWGILNKWVDPRTASKLVIVPAPDVLCTLSVTIDIHHIPTQYGGQFSFQYGMPPKVDEGILQSVMWSSGSSRQLPIGPIKLIANAHGQNIIVAVGRCSGEKRQDPIGVISLGQEVVREEPRNPRTE